MLKTIKPKLDTANTDEKLNALSDYITSVVEEIGFRLDTLSAKTESIKKIISQGSESE